MPRQGNRCCCKCLDVDTVMIIDTTGSMAPNVASVREFFTTYGGITLGSSPTARKCRFAVVDQKSEGDGGVYRATPPNVAYRLFQTMTSDISAIAGALIAVEANVSGGDGTASWLRSIQAVCQGWDSILGGDADKAARRRVILLIGDSIAEEGPTNPIHPTLLDVMTQVGNSCVMVYGFNYGALDGNGQVTQLASVVGGDVFPGPTSSTSSPRIMARKLCAAIAKRRPCP